MATEVAVETQQNWIGGKWVPAASGQTFEDRNPADRDEVVGLFPKSDKRDVDAAVAAAKKAYPGWKNTPAPRRAEVLYAAAEILKRDKEKLARLMTREMGKVLTETRGDVQEAIDMAYLAAGEGRRLFGFTTPSELPNKFAMCIRQPVGVCAFVTPWNFPMAIPAWKSMAALIAGNTIVIKPATDTPASVVALARVFEEAGLPPGVFNVVMGSGGEVGDPLVQHPGRQGRLVHGLDRGRPADLAGLRADVQAAAPRDGRQERDPRHGRRGRGPRGRRRGLGRLRHDRPALHGGLAPSRAQGGLQGVRRQARGAGEGPPRGQRPRSERRHGALRLREAARDGLEVRRDRQERRRASRDRRPEALRRATSAGAGSTSRPSSPTPT